MAGSKRSVKDPLPPPSPDEDSSGEEDSSDEDDKPLVKRHPGTNATKDREQEEEDDEEEDDEGGDDEEEDGKEGDDEEEDDDDEDDDDDDDAEKKKPAQPQPQPQAKPQPKQSPAKSKDESSSSGEEEESESDEEDKPVAGRRHPRGPDPSIKPISSKPMDVTPNGKQKKPTSASTTAADKKKQQMKKEGDVAAEPDTAGKKRNLFERFWSEEDEVKILQGIVDYHSRKGTDPSSNTNIDGLHEFMKTALKSSEFSKSQLGDKIRRLKKKYETSLSRAKGGAEPSFTKEREQKAYELSKKIWGPKKSNNGDKQEVEPSKGEASGADVDIGGDADEAEPEDREDHVASPKAKKKRSIVPHNAKLANGVDDSELSYEFLKEAIAEMGNNTIGSLAARIGLKSVDPVKAKTLDDKFKKLRMAEMKHHMHYLDLMAETIKLIMDGLSKSG